MKFIVVDSSVVVKWFNKEAHTDLALKLRDGFEKGDYVIAAPQLLIYEVSNALRYTHDYGTKDVAKSIEDLLDSEIQFLHVEKNWLVEAADLAFKNALTFYDAAYLAAATYLNAPLYTADKKILEAAKGQFVKNIAEFGK